MNFDNTLDGKMDTILFVLYGERLKKLKREKVMSAEEFGRYLNTECEGEPKIDKTSFFDSLYLNGYIDISAPGSVPYLTDDGSRFFRAGGYSQKQRDKEVLERSPGNMYQEIDSNLLPDLDIEKYANWVLSHKSVTRNEKKKIALSLLGNKERTFSNYRFVVGEVFYKTTYWKEPTAQDIDNFPLWKKDSYDRELHFYHFKIDGNPLPHKMIAEDVIGLIIEKLNKLHPQVLLDIFNTWLTEDYFGLAQVLGMVNAIKEIKNEVTSAQNTLTKSPTDQQPIKQSKSNSKKNYSDYTVAAFCYYFLMKTDLRTDYKSELETLQMDAVKAICEEFKLNSVKKFQLKFNSLYECSPSKLILHTKRGDRHEILERLKPHHVALLLAEKNLMNNEGNL